MNGERLKTPSALWCMGVATALMVIAGWGTFLYATNWQTVYWNLGNNSHLYSYLHPALYIVAALAAVYAVALTALSMRSPGQRSGRLLISALLVLLALTVWACISTLQGRALLV